MQVTPEFSVRLLDETFQKENDTIQDIQKEMVKYFLGRSGSLAQNGITGRSSQSSISQNSQVQHI